MEVWWNDTEERGGGEVVGGNPVSVSVSSQQILYGLSLHRTQAICLYENQSAAITSSFSCIFTSKPRVSSLKGHL
jgi:hypothetical protein